MPLVDRLKRHIDRAELVSLLQEFVRIPSVTGSEDAAQERMAARLAELGGKVDAWRPDLGALAAQPGFPGARVLGSRLNVVATFEGAASGPTLVLNGHMDTVTAGDESRWTYPPFAGEVADGKLYGRGTADMKGGLVAMLGAVQAVRRAGLHLKGSVCFQSVLGEEDGGAGTFAAIGRGHRGDAVVVCEPTSLAVCPAQSGVTLFRIRVRGRAAHGAVRAEGVSAFERFLPVHQALQDLERERNGRLRHPLYGHTTLPWPLSIGIVKAGTWPAIVPEELLAEGRIGVAIGEAIATARQELEKAVEQAASRDPWLTEHRPVVEWVGGTWEGVETPREHPLVQVLGEAVGEASGASPKVQGVSYGSDMRLFMKPHGIPGVLFGPGDIRLAHFTDEHVPIAELETAALALALTIARFCGTA